MTKAQYGVIEEKREQPKFPVRRLLRVPHQGRALVVSRDAFGPNTFNNNVTEMQKSYCYPHTHEIISFRDSTTSESISAIAYDFANIAKPEIFDLRWLQAGRVFKAPEWVVVNPPRDEKGEFITDEETLRNYLNGIKKVNGIYRLPDEKIEGVRDCSFVPYESFAQGVQSGEDFARSGLARGLEFADGTKAPNLEIIAAKENYPRGVNVFGFSPEDKLRVVGLYSGGVLVDGGLDVYGNHWDDDYDGCASGVLDKSAEGASQKNKQ